MRLTEQQMRNAGFRLCNGEWVKHYGRFGVISFDKDGPTPYQLIRDVEYLARQRALTESRDALEELENN